MKTTLLRQGKPVLEHEEPPATFERFVVVKWWRKYGTWFAVAVDSKKAADEEYERGMKDVDYSSVRLFWVSESCAPVPEDDEPKQAADKAAGLHVGCTVIVDEIRTFDEDTRAQ